MSRHRGKRVRIDKHLDDAITTKAVYLAAYRVVRAKVGVTVGGIHLVGGDTFGQTGEGFYHTTPSGKTRVHYPGAYKWRTAYVHSSWETTIGLDLLPASAQRDVVAALVLGLRRAADTEAAPFNRARRVARRLTEGVR